MIKSKRSRIAMLLACALVAPTALGQPAASSADSPVPPAVQEVRRHMLDGDINTLTFRSMGEIFDTRPVPRSGKVRALPRAERPLDLTYVFGGVTRTASEGLDRTFTNALLVIKDGKIVHETYRNYSSERTEFASWSMAKSMVGLLVGAAIADGSIKSIDDMLTAYIPELKGSGYDGVTIRQALQMRSGVGWEERYDFGANPSPAARIFEEALVSGRKRYADAALGTKRAHEPGKTFNYSTVETAVLGWLIERATGRDVASYTAEKLWKPIGAEADGFWIADGPKDAGREFTGAGFNARLRDYGRLGQMILDRGKVNGRQVFPAAWIKESTTAYVGPGDPAPGPIDYGYQWWTVKGSSAFFAQGLQGQFILIDPTTRTVVVKLSYIPPASGAVTAEAGALLQAIAAWQPR